MINTLRTLYTKSFSRPYSILASREKSIVNSQLESLLYKKVDCLIINNYLQKNHFLAEQEIIKTFLKQPSHPLGDHQYLNLTCQKAHYQLESRYFYHFNASRGLKLLRESAPSHKLWIDKLLLDLDVEYSAGAQIETPGLARKQSFIAQYYQGSSVAIEENHIIPESFMPKFLKYHFLALQFLSVPEKGVDMRLFSKYESNPFSEDYHPTGLNSRQVDTPKFSMGIQPQPGSLLILDGQIPVKLQLKDKNSSMMVLQSYILYRGDDKSLTIMR